MKNRFFLIRTFMIGFCAFIFLNFSSLAAAPLIASEILSPADFVDQEYFIQQQMQDDVRFPKNPNLMAVWIKNGELSEDQNCHTFKSMDHFYNITDSNDEYTTYQVRLIPSWNGQTCEYKFEKKLLTFKEAQRYIMGKMSFSIAQMKSSLKVSFQNAVTKVQNQYPHLTIESLVLNAPLPPQDPPLYFQVTAIACKGRPNEVRDHIFIQASNGSMKQDSWVPSACD